MFWSEQMFPNPHGGCVSENNTPVPGVTLELLATNCYLLKLIKIEHQKGFIGEGHNTPSLRGTQQICVSAATLTIMLTKMYKSWK